MNFEQRAITRFIHTSRITGFFLWAVCVTDVTNFPPLFFVLPCPNRWVPFLHHCEQRQMQTNRHLCSVVWLPREAVVCEQRPYQDTNNLIWCSLEMALHYKYSRGVLHAALPYLPRDPSAIRSEQERCEMLTLQKNGGANYCSLRCLNK